MKSPWHAASWPDVRRRCIVRCRFLQHLHPLLLRPEHRSGADDRVRCRYVTIVAGALLILLSLLPKAAFLIASIPPAVLGGASIAMFGMVTATGIKILQEADISDRRNQLLVAVSVGFGLIPVVRPEFFAQMPHWMEPITHSGIAMATVSALVLNLLFNILGGAERAVHNAAHQH